MMGRTLLIKAGATVLYRLTADDLRRVEAQRDSTPGFVGEAHQIGDQVPMVVVCVIAFPGTDNYEVDGQAFLRGNDSLYVASASEGGNDGDWEAR